LAFDSLAHIPVGAARGAGILDDGTGPTARGAGGLHPKDARGLQYLSAAAAVAAQLALGAGLGARSAAGGADFVPLEFDRLGHALGGFHQVERHVAADVAPLVDLAPAA